MSQYILDMIDGLKDEIRKECEGLEDENFDLKKAVELLTLDKKRLTKQVDHLTEMLLRHEQHISGDIPCNPVMRLLKSLIKV